MELQLLKDYSQIVSRKFENAILQISFDGTTDYMDIYIIGVNCQVLIRLTPAEYLDIEKLKRNLECLLIKYERGCIKYANSKKGENDEQRRNN